MVGEYISLLLKQIGAPTTPAFSHPSFPEGGEAIRRKPFGKKGKKGENKKKGEKGKKP
ncbi:hypothetical protein [Bacteroides caccae]|uniref:hypothetical protein n=1 Tax=Bacteroides caccae TaxID=47678 RepID=UPI0015F76771|nr:hypothetical protein [Bacteroides caccae]